MRTERLLLRGWTDHDRAPFAAINADPEVMKHFPAPLTRAGSDAFVDRIERHFEAHGFGLWAVEAGGELAGYTGLSIPRFHGCGRSPSTTTRSRTARPCRPCATS
ncbi:MAG: GNAT family N-acetyltransferase [Dermatophilaceae bacterium]|nr:GNAT family N-acetyltransferase [Dermatophilaceae bacterium]